MLLLLVVTIAGSLAALLGSGLGGTSAPSQTALTDIPPEQLVLYQQAATVCPGLDWTLLAAIGKIESDHGRSTLPGVRTGENPHRAAGPMQFIPTTWNAVLARHQIPPGGATPPSRYNPHDAIHAAAFFSDRSLGCSRRPLWGPRSSRSRARLPIMFVTLVAQGHGRSTGVRVAGRQLIVETRGEPPTDAAASRSFTILGPDGCVHRGGGPVPWSPLTGRARSGLTPTTWWTTCGGAPVRGSTRPACRCGILSATWARSARRSAARSANRGGWANAPTATVRWARRRRV